MKDLVNNLRSIEKESDVRATLEQMLEVCGTLDCVVILAIDKEGQQHLRTSTMSAQEKSFLLTFFDAYVKAWFRFI